jgi:hypothetical protein
MGMSRETTSFLWAFYSDPNEIRAIAFTQGGDEGGALRNLRTGSSGQEEGKMEVRGGGGDERDEDGRMEG